MRNIILFFLLFFSSNIYSQGGWYTQYNSQAPDIEDIYFINADTGWAVGYSGTILKTVNGGTNWVSYNLSPDYQISTVRFVNANTGFASGFEYNGEFIPYLFRTTDGGISWNVCFQLFGISGSLNTISFIDENTGFFGITYFGTCYIYETTNSGINWNLTNANFGNGYGISSIDFRKPERGFASVYRITSQNQAIINKIFKSTDAGTSWFELQCDTVPYSNTNYNRKIYFLNGITGYLQRGTLLKSTNGGLNFVSKATGFINSFCFSNKDTGWCTGYNGKIIRTTDGGDSWIPQNIISTSDLFPVFFIDSKTGWAGGYLRNSGGALIVKTYSGGILSVYSNNNDPDDLILLQNYPNPFNPSTNIKFTIPTSGIVKLTVYNSLGTRISSLADESFPAGTYEIRFDEGKYNLPSGIYFFVLKYGDIKLVRKLILLK